MNELVDADHDVIAIGKIADIFNGEGITEAFEQLAIWMVSINYWMSWKKISKVLSFTNLVDFDALFGHRRDPIGYGNALQEFDARLPEIIDIVA